jgi:hypothetical protein
MLSQLFRQEAVDAYTERWLVEVSELAGVHAGLLAGTGATALTFLIGVLIFGSFSRECMVNGILDGTSEQSIAVSALGLQAGRLVPIQVEDARGAMRTFKVRILSVVPLPSLGRIYLKFEVPPTLQQAAGRRFLARIASERRRIYQWMFPLFGN